MSVLGIVKEMFYHAVVVRVGSTGESWSMVKNDGVHVPYDVPYGYCPSRVVMDLGASPMWNRVRS